MSKSRNALIILMWTTACLTIIFFIGATIMIIIKNTKLCKECNYGTNGYQNDKWRIVYTGDDNYKCFNINQAGIPVYKNITQKPVCLTFFIIFVIGSFISAMSSIICAILIKYMEPLPLPDEIKSTDDAYTDIECDDEINLTQSGVTPYAKYYEIHEKL